MRVKNFDDPVSMADGTLKTLAGMGGDSGGGSGGTPVAGLTLEEIDGDDLPMDLTHDGIIIIVHDDVEYEVQITAKLPGFSKALSFNTAKNTIFVCPVKDGTRIEGGGWPSHDASHNTLLYYH